MIYNELQNKNKKMAVIGLGYVGPPRSGVCQEDLGNRI